MRFTEPLARHAAAVAGTLAALAALPALAMPFLSDDWALVRAVERGAPLATPFGDFRPLLMLSLWLDRRIFGLSATGFHLTQVALVALAAALVVRTVDRLCGDRGLAFGAGVLFALHPYHVETAAWIASRNDPLYTVPVLLALLAYERWRGPARGIPVTALVLLEMALLAKETALVMPLLVATLALLDPARRRRADEWRRGIAPLVLLVAAHFALRSLVLGGPGRTLLGQPILSALKCGLGYLAGAILPVDPEGLAFRPVILGGLAAAAFAVLAIGAMVGGRRLPPPALGGAVVLAILLIPNTVGFQRRYFFLPAAASALVLAALLRAAPRRAATALTCALVAGWSLASVGEWGRWREAARASRGLVAGLARISAAPEVNEVVIANMPLLVAGCSVGGDMEAALVLSGARAVPVRALAWVAYPHALSEALADAPPGEGGGGRAEAEVRLRIADGPRSYLAGPRPAGTASIDWPGYGSLSWDGAMLGARFARAPGSGRALVAWTGGRLVTIGGP